MFVDDVRWVMRSTARLRVASAWDIVILRLLAKFFLDNLWDYSMYFIFPADAVTITTITITRIPHILTSLLWGMLLLPMC